MANRLSVNRQAAGDVWRPQGMRKIGTVNGLSGAAPAATSADLIGKVDLSKPVHGFRFVVKGRVSVATAAYTTVNPENILNLVSKIRVTGQSQLTGSQVTLCDLDLATLFDMAQATSNNRASVKINSVEADRPSIPYVWTSQAGATLLPLSVGPFDFIVVVDLPLGPFSPIGRLSEVGFIMRASEFPNGADFHFDFPAIVDNSDNVLGTSAATSVTSIFASGGSTGSMTIDVYSLSSIQGSVRNLFIPGIITRSTLKINSSQLQNTATDVVLAVLNRRRTTRVYTKIGTGGTPGIPTFKTLSDAIVTGLGIQVGGDLVVRNKFDIEAVRQDVMSAYGIPPILGFYVLDFVQSGNVDSAYDGDNLSSAANLELVGDVTLNANGQGIVVQEQALLLPNGPLFGGG